MNELGFNKTILKLYRETYSDYPFVLEEISNYEENITDENEVLQEELIVSSDLRPKQKCEDILEMTDLCEKQSAKGTECLTEKTARSLINFMLVHYMLDTKSILPQAVFDGKIFYIT